MIHPALPALALLALTACGARTATRFVGAVTPTTPGPTCTPTRGSLEIRGEDAVFAPNQATWILHGNLKSGGLIQAEHSTTGVDKKLYDTNLEAHLTPTGVEGTYTTPRCTYQVTLANTR